MIDFAAARTNMVDCQIETNGIVMPELLAAFSSVPKEIFVPNIFKNVAYADNTIKITEDRYILEPMVHAKMVQALQPKDGDVVLDIGGSTGYSAAILSPLVTTVIAVEDNAAYLDHAAKNWDESGSSNVVGVEGTLADGYVKNAPYDMIFLGGAVTEIPTKLTNQLAVGGRMILIVKEKGDVMGRAMLVQRFADDRVSALHLFEAGAPYLSGCEPKSSFEF